MLFGCTFECSSVQVSQCCFSEFYVEINGRKMAFDAISGIDGLLCEKYKKVYKIKPC